MCRSRKSAKLSFADALCARWMRRSKKKKITVSWTSSPTTSRSLLKARFSKAAFGDRLSRPSAHSWGREAEILRLYFGLDGEEPMTLDQIGSRFGLTRERVRQIKEKALHRLRHPSRCDQLRTYSRA